MAEDMLIALQYVLRLSDLCFSTRCLVTDLPPDSVLRIAPWRVLHLSFDICLVNRTVARNARQEGPR